jgi:hypothetical protein
LGEIDLQVRGYEAFQISTVAKALEITAKQKEDLEKNASQIKEEILKSSAVGRALGGAAGGGVAVGGGGYSPQALVQLYKDVEEGRDKGMKQAMAILIDEQKTTWKKLTGEPISFPITSIWAQGGYKVCGIPLLPLPPGIVVPGGPAPRPGIPGQPADPKKEK